MGVGKVDLNNDEVFSQDIARLLGELRATRWLRDGTVHTNKNTVHLFFAFDFPFVCLLANLVVNLEEDVSRACLGKAPVYTFALNCRQEAGVAYDKKQTDRHDD